MDIQNTRNWVRFGLSQQLAGTLAITLLAFLIRLSLQPVLQPYGVFHFFIVASLLVQYLFGYRMALIAVVLSLALGEVFFVAPFGEFTHLEDKDLILSLNFVLVILPAIFLVEKLQRSLYGRELLAQVNATRMLVALRRENDRIYFGKKADFSSDLIQSMLGRFEQLLFVKTPAHAVMRGPAFFQIIANGSSGNGEWPDCIDPQDWQDICQPLAEPGWQAKRQMRDFAITVRLSTGEKKLSGQVLSFQVQDQQTELWVLNSSTQ